MGVRKNRWECARIHQNQTSFLSLFKNRSESRWECARIHQNRWNCMGCVRKQESSIVSICGRGQKRKEISQQLPPLCRSDPSVCRSVGGVRGEKISASSCHRFAAATHLSVDLSETHKLLSCDKSMGGAVATLFCACVTLKIGGGCHYCVRASRWKSME